MADPKYAGLPGIDTESKDVYESGDLPEEDQHTSPEELESTSVEVVDTKTSFEKFSGKYISGVGKDFSGRMQDQKLTGYDVGDFGLVPPGDKETIVQRLNRLKIEVSELIEDVDKIKKARPSDVSAASMIQQVHSLQSQLDGIEPSDIVGKSLSDDVNVTQILTELQKKPNSKSQNTSGNQHGVYELYLKPGQQEKKRLQVSQLEQRVARLEKVLGSSSSDMNVLTSSASGRSLHDAVQAMETKLSLLDPDQLPRVDSRLQAILNKVNEINKSQKPSDDAGSAINKKISNLHECVQKWEGVRGALPMIVERLSALDSLHAKATDFSATLSHLEAMQTKMKARLDSTNTTQQKLDQALGENLSAVESNVAQLNKRISSVSGK